VELSSIKMDLYRRDFTINALAVHLNPGHFGELVDFFGAQRDIKDKVVRVLHSLSFVEDPTRILRAIRFSERYGFRIGVQTERLIKNALQHNFFHKLSGARLFHELSLILGEDTPLSCLRRMQQYKLLTAIHPLLNLDAPKEALLTATDNVIKWFRLLYLDDTPRIWLVFFLALCSGLDEEQFEIIGHRLGFTKKTKAEIAGLRRAVRQTAHRLYNWEYLKLPISELYFLLNDLPLEGLLYLMARNPKESIQKHISLYLTKLRDIQIEITGDDLQIMGVEPGPRYARILRAITASAVDGVATSRERQLELAGRLARGEISDEPPVWDAPEM
jgi:tRNA nucleotidyltransferase (CCA-adding enzyme)